MESERVKTAFTLGSATEYDAYIEESTKANDLPLKRGRYPGYTGGWVWATAADAAAFLDSDTFRKRYASTAEFAVYELELAVGWTNDVALIPREEDGVPRLINDAVIVRRVGIVKEIWVDFNSTTRDGLWYGQPKRSNGPLQEGETIRVRDWEGNRANGTVEKLTPGLVYVRPMWDTWEPVP